MQGTGEIVTALLAALLDGENMDVMLRGVWLTSSLQRGRWMIFSRSPPPASTDWVTARWQRPLVETTPYFTRRLFPEVLLAEPNGG